MPKIFYNINEVINTPFISDNPIFIIAHDSKRADGSIGRMFIAFSSYASFKKSREKFKHSHEILVNHINNEPNSGGRLVFDFDIKYSDAIKIPKKFKGQIEETIYKTIEKYYVDIDTTNIEFVWSTSENEKKMSKHLTVKNFYFEQWIKMSKIFYSLFSIIWDSQYDWIKSDELIDIQIAREKTSLRMVGSSKIGGNVLQFDDDNFELEDSLIRIYDKENDEQIINEHDLVSDYEDCLPKLLKKQNKKYVKKEFISQDPIYKSSIYKKAFDAYNDLYPNIFTMGKVSGLFLTLVRINSAPCYLSGKTHDAENAYLSINEEIQMSETPTEYYRIYYGCYRKCNKKHEMSLLAYMTVSKDKQTIKYPNEVIEEKKLFEPNFVLKTEKIEKIEKKICKPLENYNFTNEQFTAFIKIKKLAIPTSQLGLKKIYEQMKLELTNNTCSVIN
jgi:hypothetical protein